MNAKIFYHGVAQIFFHGVKGVFISLYTPFTLRYNSFNSVAKYKPQSFIEFFLRSQNSFYFIYTPLLCETTPLTLWFKNENEIF